MFTYMRIFLTLTEVSYAMSWFTGLIAIFIYALLFTVIPSFKERGEFIINLDYNYTNLAMRFYRPYVKEVVEERKRDMTHE